MKQNKQNLYISDLEFKPIHKFFRVTISSIKHTKNTKSDIISLHKNNHSPGKIKLPLGLLVFCKTNAATSPTKEIAYRVNDVLKFLFIFICQSTILNEKFSVIL